MHYNIYIKIKTKYKIIIIKKVGIKMLAKDSKLYSLAEETLAEAISIADASDLDPTEDVEFKNCFSDFLLLRRFSFLLQEISESDDHSMLCIPCNTKEKIQNFLTDFKDWFYAETIKNEVISELMYILENI